MTELIAEIENWLDKMGAIGSLIRFGLAAVWAILVTTVIIRLGKHVFEKRLKHKDNIQIRFVENILRAAVVIIAVFWVFNYGEGAGNFGKVLFQGTAIVSAIVGLAAQPVISDLCCGLVLITSKPFEIGDRIELEDGTAGIVKDINLRHVVINRIDSIDMIIPNSRLNSMALSNMSRNPGRRSVHMRFSVGYGADPELVESVIRNAVISSHYTVAGKQTSYGPDYGPVYFLEYAESALVFGTTVYYTPDTPTEVLKSDINQRVGRALVANDIEIPYNYVNVVMQK